MPRTFNYQKLNMWCQMVHDKTRLSLYNSQGGVACPTFFVKEEEGHYTK
jgi:hypothetical protein